MRQQQWDKGLPVAYFSTAPRRTQAITLKNRVAEMRSKGQRENNHKVCVGRSPALMSAHFSLSGDTISGWIVQSASGLRRNCGGLNTFTPKSYERPRRPAGKPAVRRNTESSREPKVMHVS